jgi:hypothetical protein
VRGTQLGAVERSGMITPIKLCSPAECERLVTAVYALRDYWVERGPNPCALFSLAAASYFDDLVDYRRIAAVCNPLLMKSFGDLLGFICSTLAPELGAPVRLADDLALPGFHIFRTSALSATFKASIHFDLQYERFKWFRRCGGGALRSEHLIHPAAPLATMRGRVESVALYVPAGVRIP